MSKSSRFIGITIIALTLLYLSVRYDFFNFYLLAGNGENVYETTNNLHETISQALCMDNSGSNIPLSINNNGSVVAQGLRYLGFHMDHLHSTMHRDMSYINNELSILDNLRTLGRPYPHGHINYINYRINQFGHDARESNGFVYGIRVLNGSGEISPENQARFNTHLALVTELGLFRERIVSLASRN